MRWPDTLLFLKVFCALKGNLTENSSRADYVIVSIKFIYLNIGDNDDIVLCNFNNKHIMSQPTTFSDHFSLTGIYNSFLINSHVQGQWGILGGLCRSVHRILTIFQTKKCHFHARFQTLASKIHTCFQTWRWSQNATYVH